MVEIMRDAGDLMTQLHIADSFDHTGSSGLRYITNPPGQPDPGASAPRHRPGRGWGDFFATVKELGFDAREGTVMTVCVFAWEERAAESCVGNRERIAEYTRHW